MECTACKRFEALLAEKIEPLFNKQLRVVFKHYPLCNQCNPYVETNISRHACTAAHAVEAARLQGGTAMFCKMRDEIMARSNEFASIDYAGIATLLGMDVDQFVEDMQSSEIHTRITDDIVLGHQLGVVRTPTLFLNNRLAPNLVQDRLDFWKQVSSAAAPTGS